MKIPLSLLTPLSAIKLLPLLLPQLDMMMVRIRLSIILARFMVTSDGVLEIDLLIDYPKHSNACARKSRNGSQQFHGVNVFKLYHHVQQLIMIWHT
jgi:hypothetical protein